jgi:transcriptional regulator with XRE-family HTH domain
MEIGSKLRKLREAKNLSQGDIEKRTGLVRSYTSRVENGHTVPLVGTLEKYARALEVPLYRFFTDEVSVKTPKLLRLKDDSSSWGTRGRARGEFRKLAWALARMDERDRSLLVSMAQGMARLGAKR